MDFIYGSTIKNCTQIIARYSATPKNYKDAYLIEIPEEDVIAEGLIKNYYLSMKILR